MTWFLDLRAQAAGGGVASEVAIYEQDRRSSVARLQQATDGHDVLLVTHGFNVDRAAGRRALGFWESWQSLPPGVVYVGVLWPGDSTWLHGLDYPIEGGEAIHSGDRLAGFVLDTFQATTSLAFCSHSLGARVMLQAIRSIARSGRAHPPILRLLLMAGAIDDTCLTGEYAGAATAVTEISVLASQEDTVLAMAFPLGNPIAGIFTRGSPYWHAAIGREGPSLPTRNNVHHDWQIPDGWSYRHGDYLPDQAPTAPPFPRPQLVPPQGTRPPAQWPDWRAAWSAAILSTRYR
jgi:Alpha/beta hydrolase of unknown function (DUF900)